jgi:hypothetical protein
MVFHMVKSSKRMVFHPWFLAAGKSAGKSTKNPWRKLGGSMENVI